jgi:glycosyltransferase involved in cell wall biosynthesis
MNILVFSPYYLPHIGGLESHSEEFDKELALQGLSILVYTPQLPASAAVSEETAGVKVIRYPAFEIIPNYPLPKFWHLDFWRSFRSLYAKDIDFTISRTRFFFASLMALFYAKTARTRLIHIEHGSDFVVLSSRFTSIVARLYDLTFGRLVLRSSDHTVSISQAVSRFVKRFDARPSSIIYRGIDFSAIDSIAPSESLRKHYPGKLILATAARLYRWKGIECTIEAIRLLPESFRSQIVFLIIGDGEDFNRLTKLSQGLPITLLGNLPRTEVMSLLKAADIYIHSSSPGGGLSTSLLEAMSCGKAVIATPHEGADEVVIPGQTGLCVESGSAESFSQAIQKLVGDEALRQSLGTQAAAHIRKNFSWEKSIRQYIDLLKTYGPA